MTVRDPQPPLPAYPDLDGKVVLVTGGSRGIGAATCRLFALNGARVAVNGRDEAAIEQVVSSIRARDGTAIGAPADCTDAAAIEQMCRHVEQGLGTIAVLVAFAGGLGNPIPTLQISPEQWRAAIESDLTATFLTVRSVLPGMTERRRGAIITMASSAGRLPGLASAAYAAAKAGVIMFSRHLARELGPYGIRINCVAPSAILTEGGALQRLSEEQRQQVAASFPLGRVGTPEDVALATLFLASASSSWLTGITLDVAGGRIIV